MELFRALAAIAEAPGPQTLRIASALELPGAPSDSEHTDLFVLQLWPYASIYMGAEGKIGGEARDRVAGFWRALHLTPPVEPDHLAALLGLYAALAGSQAAESDAARRGLRRRARQALLWEHLLSWLPVYLAKVDEIGSPFYRGWGRLLNTALMAEANEFGSPDQLPIHLREAPVLVDPTTDGAEGFINGLLAPAACGMLLTRDDLCRAARELGLGLRQGERIYVLKALLAQDPGTTLRWLGREAERWALISRSMPTELGLIRDFWCSRAEISALRLGAQIPA